MPKNFHSYTRLHDSKASQSYTVYSRQRPSIKGKNMFLGQLYSKCAKMIFSEMHPTTGGRTTQTRKGLTTNSNFRESSPEFTVTSDFRL